MSERPTQCKFCGCEEVHSDGFPAIDGGRETRFECGTLWREDGQIWVQDTIRCAGIVGNLFRRIRRAVESLKAAERYDLRPMGNYMGDGMFRDDKHGEWAEAKVLDTVLAILSEDAGSKAGAGGNTKHT